MASTPKGPMVSTSNVLDIQNLDKIKSFNDPNFKIFLSRLRNMLNNMSIAVNSKPSNKYPLTEYATGKLYFPTTTGDEYRQSFLTSVNFGALPNATSKSVAHGITFDANVSFVRVWATATDPAANTISIPYCKLSGSGLTVDLTDVEWQDTSAPITAASLASAIDFVSIEVDTTNVTITTTTNKSGFTTCYAFLEYLKN